MLLAPLGPRVPLLLPATLAHLPSLTSHGVAGGSVSMMAHLHKLGVRLRRKDWISLEERSNPREVERFEVIDEHDGVRVSHPHARHLPLLPCYCEWCVDYNTLGVGWERRGDVGSLEERLTHVDAHCAICTEIRHDQTRQRRDSEGALKASLKLAYIACHAADPVPAHLRLRTVGVVDAHAVLSVRRIGWENEDHAVRPDSEVAVAHPCCLFRRERRLALRAAVDEDEVVAEAVILSKINTGAAQHADTARRPTRWQVEREQPDHVSKHGST